MDFSAWSLRGRLECANRILAVLNSTAPISFSARNQLSGLAFSNDWGEFECPKSLCLPRQVSNTMTPIASVSYGKKSIILDHRNGALDVVDQLSYKCTGLREPDGILLDKTNKLDINQTEGYSF